jgi:BirA family biotin operon repressor/biotin-[acetyl-CoA-carboxylase] ligase
MDLSPPLTPEHIRSTLETAHLGRNLRLHPVLSSTNEEAMALGQAGAEHGTVVVAESQTAGRGRHGRTWFSPPGHNLYCSVLVRTSLPTGQALPVDRLSWIPLTAAMTAADAVRVTASVPLMLKWPNDLLLDGRKVGGILCESGGIGTAGAFVVIGLGLNVNVARDSFPPDLQLIAGSLRERTGKPIDRNRLLAQWLLELERLIDTLAGQGPQTLREAYLALCSTVGQHVKVLLGAGQELVGIARGIGLDGSLHVLPAQETSSPTARGIIEIRAADVIHLRQ